MYSYNKCYIINKSCKYYWAVGTYLLFVFNSNLTTDSQLIRLHLRYRPVYLHDVYQTDYLSDQGVRLGMYLPIVPIKIVKNIDSGIIE